MVLNKGEDILPTILIVHFPAQDFSHILLVFLMSVLLFTSFSRSILCTSKAWYSISSIFVFCRLIPETSRLITSVVVTFWSKAFLF